MVFDTFTPVTGLIGGALIGLSGKRVCLLVRSQDRVLLMKQSTSLVDDVPFTWILTFT